MSDERHAAGTIEAVAEARQDFERLVLVFTEKTGWPAEERAATVASLTAGADRLAAQTWAHGQDAGLTIRSFVAAIEDDNEADERIRRSLEAMPDSLRH